MSEARKLDEDRVSMDEQIQIIFDRVSRENPHCPINNEDEIEEAKRAIEFLIASGYPPHAIALWKVLNTVAQLSEIAENPEVNVETHSKIVQALEAKAALAQDTAPRPDSIPERPSFNSLAEFHQRLAIPTFLALSSRNGTVDSLKRAIATLKTIPKHLQRLLPGTPNKATIIAKIETEIAIINANFEGSEGESIHVRRHAVRHSSTILKNLLRDLCTQ